MPEAGTYLLLMHLDREAEIPVGHLGTFGFAAGYYCYVGSARGPGGIAARVRRHLRGAKRPHWHVDYLLFEAPVMEIWATRSTDRLECIWAQALLSLPEVTVPVRGFGSSDCSCQAHLFRFPAFPSLRAFSTELQIRASGASLQVLPPTTPSIPLLGRSISASASRCEGGARSLPGPPSTRSLWPR